MELFEDLKYVGSGSLNVYENKIWHCTSFVTRLSTRDMEFIVQQPHYHEDIFMGYTGLEVYVLTEDELVNNFKIVKEDGRLENIQHSKDNKELQKKIQDINKYFKNLLED
ncbi:hypothetical protein EJM73_08895 [Clostridium botulinum]|uniref:hypothetical protein n=1 Tax=Clostridium botulinum TaxID=1491 RepID=UPI001375791F|nr:hypothetical protein [Clostridium botulinum]NCI19741.1 hypothetical protein [Clostridium botulinum]NCI35779.1 hypothetical protein [Clostridium botulinum]NCI71636.1 hypothetical protein [Clostridium botulinum]NDI38828.1 hypothetical protein [Clostridium botulinum]